MKDKISLVTIADFGEIKNLKTDQSYYAVKKFLEKNELNNIFCRQSKNTNLPVVPLGTLDNIFLKSTRALNVITSKTIRKKFNIYYTILDYSIFSRIRKQKIKSKAVYFVPYLFPRTLGYCNKKGIITILSGTSEHPKVTQKVQNEEREKFRLPIDTSHKDKAHDTIKKADYITALSNYTKKTYVEQGISGDKIKVLYPGINAKRFKPGNKKDKTKKITYITVASFNLRKGLYYLLKAWEELQLENAELIVVGSINGEAARSIENINTKNVKIISHTDPVKYYKKADVFVFPTLSDSFGRTGLEALSSGLPLIVTKTAGCSEIIKDNKHGFKIERRNIKQLKDKMLYFYKNPREIERMGKNARKLVEIKYTMEKYSERAYKVISSCIK